FGGGDDLAGPRATGPLAEVVPDDSEISELLRQVAVRRRRRACAAVEVSDHRQFAQAAGGGKAVEIEQQILAHAKSLPEPATGPIEQRFPVGPSPDRVDALVGDHLGQTAMIETDVAGAGSDAQARY